MERDKTKTMNYDQFSSFIDALFPPEPREFNAEIEGFKKVKVEVGFNACMRVALVYVGIGMVMWDIM